MQSMYVYCMCIFSCNQNLWICQICYSGFWILSWRKQPRSTVKKRLRCSFKISQNMLLLYKRNPECLKGYDLSMPFVHIFMCIVLCSTTLLLILMFLWYTHFRVISQQTLLLVGIQSLAIIIKCFGLCVSVCACIYGCECSYSLFIRGKCVICFTLTYTLQHHSAS